MTFTPTALLDIEPGAYSVLLAVTTLVGLLLCLFGKKLIRVVCAAAGVLIGGLIAFLLPRYSDAQHVVMLQVAGGCLIGLVSGWLFFRVWMGAWMAVLLASLLPGVGLALQNNLPPVDGEGIRSMLVEEDVHDGGDEDATPRLSTRLKQVLADEAEPLRDWWRSLGRGGQYMVSIFGGLGFVVGLVVGIIGPYISASIISALLGTSMILISINQANLSPINAWFPTSPAGVIILAGLITVAGIVVQCMIFRRKTDKF